MGNGVPPVDCTGNDCGYGVVNGRVGCVSGDGSCVSSQLLEAKVSDFHDRYLQDATRDIKAILDGIPPDSRGRKLSFLRTHLGTLLAWVEHPENLAEDAVTINSGDAEIINALGLILDSEQTSQAY